MSAIRTLVVSLAVAAPLLLVAQGWAKGPAACPAPLDYRSGLKTLEGYRVFTGADGDSQVEPYRIDIKQVPLLKTGKILSLVDLPLSPKRGPQIVVGPPNVELPLHTTPYKEMFILLSGTLTMKTAKFHADMKPGSVLLFEDVDAKVGHGGHIGPCGYVSISIAP